MSTIKVAVIPCDDQQPIEIREIDRGDIGAMQAIVHGNFDVIDIQNPDASIWVADDGKLRGDEPNRRGTCLLWLHNSDYRERDFIVGDCFMTGRPDDEGDTETIPDHFIDMFTKPATYRVQVQTLTDHTWSGNSLTFDHWLKAYVWGIQLAERWALVSEIRAVRI